MAPPSPHEAPHPADAIWSTGGGYWEVYRCPPAPWPTDPPGDWYPAATYGPPGTLWLFTFAQFAQRIGQLSDQQSAGLTAMRKLLARASRRYLAERIPGQPTVYELFYWVTPVGATYAPSDPRSHMTVKAIRATVHGKIGTVEEVAHVLHFCKHPETPEPDAAALRTFGQKLRDQWVAYWSAGSANATAPVELVYDEVRTAYLEFAPGVRPNYLVRTEYTPFSIGAVHGTSTFSALPYAVACCLSLNTNFRDKRAKGRMYQGPLATNAMGGLGLLRADVMGNVGHDFGVHIVDGMHLGSGWDLHVVSQKYGTSAPVQGVRVGEVPDSQRRRRRSQLERYVQVWGTPIGAL